VFNEEPELRRHNRNPETELLAVMSYWSCALTSEHAQDFKNLNQERSCDEVSEGAVLHFFSVTTTRNASPNILQAGSWRE